ncbi:MAG: hypothetical protein ABJA90_04535 [Ginsengibacter sp.]
MKPKKTIAILFFALLTSCVMPAFAGEPVTRPGTELPAESQQVLDRISEIRNMDRSNLTASEKKELRKELKHLKKEKKKNGIYLSVGAIIVIGLLLILLL